MFKLFSVAVTEHLVEVGRFMKNGDLRLSMVAHFCNPSYEVEVRGSQSKACPGEKKHKTLSEK
jgi:hypothetical protein